MASVPVAKPEDVVRVKLLGKGSYGDVHEGRYRGDPAAISAIVFTSSALSAYVTQRIYASRVARAAFRSFLKSSRKR